MTETEAPKKEALPENQVIIDDLERIMQTDRPWPEMVKEGIKASIEIARNLGVENKGDTI